MFTGKVGARNDISSVQLKDIPAFDGSPRQNLHSILHSHWWHNDDVQSVKNASIFALYTVYHPFWTTG